MNFVEIRRAWDVMVQARSVAEIGTGLDVLAGATGLANYIALDMFGGQSSLSTAIHNVPELDLGSITQSDLVTRLLARPLPVVLTDEAGFERFPFGVGASAARGYRSCVLFIGCEKAVIEGDGVAALLGVASMSATYALDSLSRIDSESCPLTAREMESLRLAAAGLDSRETAQQLGISHRTVEDFLRTARLRLNASTTASAALRALRKGWLSFEDLKATAAGLSAAGPGQVENDRKQVEE